ncbi:hypothetical protein N9L19_00355 [bacterium]|nr:hypothetical protein [bacterium]
MSAGLLSLLCGVIVEVVVELVVAIVGVVVVIVAVVVAIVSVVRPFGELTCLRTTSWRWLTAMDLFDADFAG